MPGPLDFHVADLAEYFPQANDQRSLLLVVHRDPEILRARLVQAAAELSLSVIFLQRELAAALAKSTAANRDQAAAYWIRALRARSGPDPRVLIGVDLLFEPALRLDPIKLLTSVSRAGPLIVGWPGSWDGRTLHHAVPEHGHHRIWQDPRVDIRLLTEI